MRLVSFVDGEHAAVGVVGEGERETSLLDLSIAAPSLPRSMIELLDAGDAALTLIRDAIDAAIPSSWQPLASVTLQAPVPRAGKIICVGHNYRDHSALPDEVLPEYPTFFSKYATAVTGHRHPIVLPRLAQTVDNEAELAVVIGRRGRHIAEADAMAHVAGYTILNDVSARDFQRRTTQWMMGKTFDTFAPMGPVLATADSLDPSRLELALWVNDALVQRSNTAQFIFPIPFLIAYLSAVMTLEPGDIISTGTPARLGDYRANPIWMKPGDEVRIRIDGIGELVNHFVAE